jgi:hypothetical protein
VGFAFSYVLRKTQYVSRRKIGTGWGGREDDFGNNPLVELLIKYTNYFIIMTGLNNRFANICCKV